MATLRTTEITDTGHLTLPVGTTSGGTGRPGTPLLGMMRVNTDAETDPIIEWYDGNQWNSLGQPPVGTSQDNPAKTAAEAYDAGLRGNKIWIEIDGAAYQLDYDDTDRYSTGENGWANYTNTVFGNNYQTISNSKYGVPSGNMTPAWNVGSSTSTTDTNIGTGQLRIGYELAHPGGNSLSTVRCAVPKHTSCYYQLTDAQAGGADTADFGTGWQNGNYGYNIFNNNAYESNGNGYWCIMHNGDAADTSNSTNNRILDPGNLTSGNSAWTTNNYETFGTETTDVPFIIWGTTDAYREYAYIRDWNVWVH
jgi:hypothetical protein